MAGWPGRLLRFKRRKASPIFNAREIVRTLLMHQNVSDSEINSGREKTYQFLVIN